MVDSVLRILTEAKIRWGFDPPGSSRATGSEYSGDGIWIHGDVDAVDVEVLDESEPEELDGREEEDEEDDSEEDEDDSLDEDHSSSDDKEESEEDEDEEVVLTGGRFGALSLE